MTTLRQSYSSFRYLVRNVRWVELSITALIVFSARELSYINFDARPVLIIFALAFLWNFLFWHAGRRHLLRERGVEGSRLLFVSWLTADVITTLLLVYFTGLTSSPFLFLLALPAILSAAMTDDTKQSYGVVMGTALGFLALVAMENAGSIPHTAVYPPEVDQLFTSPDVAFGIGLMIAAVLSLVVFTLYRFRPNFAFFRDGFRQGRFRIQSFRTGDIQDLRLEEVESVGPEDLLEEVVQNLTTNPAVCFAAAIVFPAGEETVGGRPGSDWHEGLTRQRAVSITRRQVIPTWSEFHTEQSDFFKSLRYGETGDLWEGPFSLLQSDGLFTSFEGADIYLATPVSQGGKAVVVLLTGLSHPVKRRNDVVLHLLRLAAQLKPLLVAESRLTRLRGEITSLHSENENLSRLNKMQAEFVGMASHELKTPLTSIGAYTDALLLAADRSEFPERREFLGVIRSEADRLLRMVNRILDYSKIEFNQRVLQRHHCQLEELLDEVLVTLRPELERSDVQVEVEMPGNLPRVEVDQDMMKQVMLNLLSNALKFSPKSSVITVSAEEAATSVNVTVRDMGPGIPEDEVQKIFQQFYRVRDYGDGVERTEGTGLGLSIVRNIVTAHGGTVNVDGGYGKGAAFSFTIPKEHHVNTQPETVLGEVTRSGEFERLMRLLVRMVADYMDCKIVSVMLLSQDRSELFVQIAYGLDESIVKDARVKVGEGIAGRVVASGRPLLIDNVADTEGLESRSHTDQYDTNSLVSVPLFMNGEVVGVINCNNKVTGDSFYADDLSLLITLTDKVTVALGRALAYENSKGTLDKTVDALQSLVELHASEVRTSPRSVRYAMDLGRRLGLTRQQVLALQYAFVIHDVGMTKLNEDIIRKRGPLSEDEVSVMHAHPTLGVEMLEPFMSADELEEIVRYHHERVDGTGYPHGLKGEHIPLPARIVSVVDAYESMTSLRAYRVTMTPADAAEELVKHAGSQFDAEVVRLFLDVLLENGELDRLSWERLKEGEQWLRPASLS
jgi:signal transduction histidine kinase/HD-GYP domain-containing protein (c-di-GMP phosphodiesterase class II)